MTDLIATLAERGARYGKFEDRAVIAQGLKDQMWATEGWSRLAPDQRQALEVIQDKVARILNGDPDYTDNWHDIAGYSRLVEDRLTERAAAMAKWNEPVSGFAAPTALTDEIARPRTAVEQQAPEAGWIEWTGGECPVPSDTRVDIKWPDGSSVSGARAGAYGWNCAVAAISAYRVCWIEWKGGERPVPADVLVDVRFRGGTIDERSCAGMWEWDTNYGDYGIVAYRLSTRQD